MNHSGYIYIMTNKNRTTLYIGVTNDLCRRINEHKNHLIKDSFTDKYNLEYCIYYEEFPYFDLAIKREKELKKWSRQKKEDLINKKNPEWKELVTEKGFVREKVSFSQQVNNVINDLQMNEQIPPYGRNDSSPCGVMGEGIGGFAANSFSPSLNEPPVISSDARNLNLQNNEVISSEARNRSNHINGVIPNETNNQKFNNTTKET